MNWIKCSDRLPEESKNYLVGRFNYVDQLILEIMRWDCKKQSWWTVNPEEYRDHEVEMNYVTHWRELPELPKELE